MKKKEEKGKGEGTQELEGMFYIKRNLQDVIANMVCAPRLQSDLNKSTKESHFWDNKKNRKK